MNSGFIGFLFKADSEGMPGPSSYNRTEPEGSSMLANAVKDIGGIIIWRAFTHPGNLGPIKVGDQPLMQFKYFMELDGLWDENVVLQIKMGRWIFKLMNCPFTFWKFEEYKSNDRARCYTRIY